MAEYSIAVTHVGGECLFEIAGDVDTVLVFVVSEAAAQWCWLLERDLSDRVVFSAQVKIESSTEYPSLAAMVEAQQAERRTRGPARTDVVTGGRLSPQLRFAYGVPPAGFRSSAQFPPVALQRGVRYAVFAMAAGAEVEIVSAMFTG